jgi:hypothetical protein
MLAAFLRRRATARRVQGDRGNADDGAMGDLQMAALAKVPKPLWPLLMNAVEVGRLGFLGFLGQ